MNPHAPCMDCVNLKYFHLLPVLVLTIFPIVTLSALITAIYHHKLEDHVDYISVIVELNPVDKYYSIFMNIVSVISFLVFFLRYTFFKCTKNELSKNLLTLNYVSLILGTGIVFGGFVVANVEKSRMKWLHYVGAGIFLTSQSFYATVITLLTFVTRQNFYYFSIRFFTAITATVCSVVAMVGCLPEFQKDLVGGTVVYYGAICEWVSVFIMTLLIGTFIPEFYTLRAKVVCEIDDYEELRHS